MHGHVHGMRISHQCGFGIWHRVSQPGEQKSAKHEKREPTADAAECHGEEIVRTGSTSKESAEGHPLEARMSDPAQRSLRSAVIG